MKSSRSLALIVVAGVALAVVLTVASTATKADTLTDPQIFVCQSCTAPPGGDPNPIRNTGAFTVGVAGSFTLQNPLLIIVGVYNASGTPSISYSGCATPSACPAATVGTYGLTANTGTLTSSSSGTAFSQLGLSAGGSESFTNWSSGDTANGFAAPTSFSLFAFALNTSLASGSPITIDESGAALGSYIIAYDCESGTGSTTSACSKNGDIAQTVFTNTGIADSAAEPSAAVLVGMVLLGFIALGAISRRKRLA